MTQQRQLMQQNFVKLNQALEEAKQHNKKFLDAHVDLIKEIKALMAKEEPLKNGEIAKFFELHQALQAYPFSQPQYQAQIVNIQELEIHLEEIITQFRIKTKPIQLNQRYEQRNQELMRCFVIEEKKPKPLAAKDLPPAADKQIKKLFLKIYELFETDQKEEHDLVNFIGKIFRKIVNELGDEDYFRDLLNYLNVILKWSSEDDLLKCFSALNKLIMEELDAQRKSLIEKKKENEANDPAAVQKAFFENRKRMQNVLKEAMEIMAVSSGSISLRQSKELFEEFFKHNFVRALFKKFIITPEGKYIELKLKLAEFARAKDSTNPEIPAIRKELAALEHTVPADIRGLEIREKTQFEMLMIFLPDSDYQAMLARLKNPPLIESLYMLQLYLIKLEEMGHPAIKKYHNEVDKITRAIDNVNDSTLLNSVFKQIKNLEVLSAVLTETDLIHVKRLLDYIVNRLKQPNLEYNLSDIDCYVYSAKLQANLNQGDHKETKKNNEEIIAANFLQIMQELRNFQNINGNLEKFRNLLKEKGVKKINPAIIILVKWSVQSLESQPEFILAKRKEELFPTNLHDAQTAVVDMKTNLPVGLPENIVDDFYQDFLKKNAIGRYIKSELLDAKASGLNITMQNVQPAKEAKAKEQNFKSQDLANIHFYRKHREQMQKLDVLMLFLPKDEFQSFKKKLQAKMPKPK